MARAKSAMAMLSCVDMDATLRFYRDRLGGAESYRFPPEGEPSFIVLTFGESEIGFGPVSQEPLHGQPQRPASGHRIELCLYVDDLEGAMRGLEQDGTPVLMPPADQPWGERCAFVSDPDGNVVMLVRGEE